MTDLGGERSCCVTVIPPRNKTILNNGRTMLEMSVEMSELNFMVQLTIEINNL